MFQTTNSWLLFFFFISICLQIFDETFPLFFIYSTTDIAGGYLCFVISILCIGVVTAIIGDVASHFGCTLGIKDSVTAIVFVALGTSIPGERSQAFHFICFPLQPLNLSQIRSLVKWLPFRTNMRMRVSEM